MLDFGRIKDYAATEYAIVLTGTSRTLLVSLLSTYAYRQNWEYHDTPPTDMQWDEIQAGLDFTVTQILTPIQTYPIGGIAWLAVADPDAGWLLCDGTVYNVVDYPVLAAKLGNTYGGDGITTFGVPNLLSRFARGSTSVAGTGGEDAHVLTIAELPSHNHTVVQAVPALAEIDVGVPTALATASSTVTGSTGSGSAHENKPPYLDLYPVIKAYEVALDTLPGAPGGVTIDYVHVQDQKASGTNGGTFTSGDWRTRTLNTLVADSGAIASLSGNRVTLPAGAYKVTGRGYAFLVNGHQARIYDVTHAAVLAIGLVARSSSADGSGTLATAGGYFALTETAQIELQHQCGTTRANTGFGQPNAFGTEIYAELEFWRIGDMP